MTAQTTLNHYLDDWAKTGDRQAVAQTIKALASAGKVISGLVAQGPLAGAVATVVGANSDGDTQKELDRLTNIQVIEALDSAPVAYIASEEMPDAVATAKPDAPLCVAIDPLDGSSNIDTNVSIGTIFSILPRLTGDDVTPAEQFFQTGRAQLAAGYIIYGPHTALVLSLGEGTHIFTLDPAAGHFILTNENMRVPEETREFAINASNYRHWDENYRVYINDCLEGEEGPRKKNFNTRWIAAMVAESHRILMRGGIYLYPGDVRPGYGDGRLRLLYEGNPVAMLMEQAGGAASNGHVSILDIVPTDIHQRVPLIFGSADEVATVDRYAGVTGASAQRSPLFGQRGLFRT